MTTAILGRMAQQLRRSASAPRAIALLCLASATAWLAHASGGPLPPRTVAPVLPVQLPLAAPGTSPRIEAAFVLDTTGSMGGLIEGAKRKIWSIANELASARNQPEIRLALIAYRDRGDTYVTELHDLTGDIDALYAQLGALQADGGGDGPESVNQALHEAVANLHWSSDPGVYRAIFLVGDAPPHMDYANDEPYTQSVQAARQRGIMVNTIQCGINAETQRVWQQIAQLNQGKYASIAQDGGMQVASAPQDEELARLNAELAGTAIAYGAPEERAELQAKLDQARSADREASGFRLSFLSKQGKRLNTGRPDLVDAIAQGDVKLQALPPQALPEPMQAMSAPERDRYIEEKREQRKDLQSRIDQLVLERDAHLSAESSRRKAQGGADSFDGEVLDAIRTQAADKGIAY